MRPIKPIQGQQKAKPLFAADEDEDEDDERIPGTQDDFDDDPELALVIQESFDHGDTSKLVTSNSVIESVPSTSSLAHPTTPSHLSSFSKRLGSDSDDDGLYTSPTRLETALSFANARLPGRPNISPQTSAFGKSNLLTSHLTSPTLSTVLIAVESNSDDCMEEVMSAPRGTNVPLPQSTLSNTEPVMSTTRAEVQPPAAIPTPQADPRYDMQEVHKFHSEIPGLGSDKLSERQEATPAIPQSPASLRRISPTSLYNMSTPPLNRSGSSTALVKGEHLPIAQALNPINSFNFSSDDEGDVLTDWSRSPSPVGVPSNKVEIHSRSSVDHEDWDAAQEMDAHAEEGEFARFVSQVNGRDIDDVRAEIDEEIKLLNHQRKTAMRDSEDITQQMISQIMVCRIALIFESLHF